MRGGGGGVAYCQSLEAGISRDGQAGLGGGGRCRQAGRCLQREVLGFVEGSKCLEAG